MGKRSRSSKKVPSRLCDDPHTQYCKGEYRHRGCCSCWEYNHGDHNRADICTPYLLNSYTHMMGWTDEFGIFLDQDLQDMC